MNTTKITISLAALLCIFLLWPAQASAGCSLHLSIGGYIGSDCASRSHHADHDGRRITYIGIDRHRRLLGHPPVRPCVSRCSWYRTYRPTYRSMVWSRHRPVREVVNVYHEPVVRVARHGCESYVQRTSVSRVKIRHR